MTESQTVAEIRRLLGLYPGVAIEEMQTQEGNTSIELRFTDAASLVWITRASEGANGSGHFWTVGKPNTGKCCFENLRQLWFRFIFGVNSHGESSLEWFGLYLVWDLAERNILQHDEAERLLKLWNGAPRW